MEKRQKNIDENFAKLVKTQEKTNNNIIETNNMLKVFLESQGISLKNDMKIGKNARWRK